jgi:hypothetical protein
MMSMLFAATYPKRRRAARQLARDDIDKMIRATVAGLAGSDPVKP